MLSLYTILNTKYYITIKVPRILKKSIIIFHCHKILKSFCICSLCIIRFFPKIIIMGGRLNTCRNNIFKRICQTILNFHILNEFLTRIMSACVKKTSNAFNICGTWSRMMSKLRGPNIFQNQQKN